MSLAEKWEEYKDSMPFEADEETWLDYQHAFYAGAEVVLPVAAYNADLAVAFQAEIDNFRKSHSQTK